MSRPDELAFEDPRRVTKALRQPEDADPVLTTLANPHARMVVAGAAADTTATAAHIQGLAHKIARAVKLSALDELGTLAVRIAERLDVDPAYAEWEARVVTEEVLAEAADVRLSDVASERLWALNQLDGALWELAQAPRGATP